MSNRTTHWLEPLALPAGAFIIPQSEVNPCNVWGAVENPTTRRLVPAYLKDGVFHILEVQDHA